MYGTAENVLPIIVPSILLDTVSARISMSYMRRSGVYATNHVLIRDGDFYYVRRVPLDLAEHYSVKRLCFSLRTKSYKSAIHASKSVSLGKIRRIN